ncbi:MAG: alpha/beta fold hydrolase [Phycisphaerales bacterium]|nr:lysophospholipase [Phycisphaerae bacterium]NNM26982.1 alpha/beta fold hydrolase [Phycisphaerales bacterium]
MTTVTDWTIPGAEGEAILGDTHASADPRATVVIAHGFKGYKDYGMFPRIAATLADAGFVAHRFNFSHSGMTNDVATFARPDLFARDTWNKQVADVRAVVSAVRDGRLAGGETPVVLFGHSRGGVSVLLAAGRPDAPPLAGIVTAAAPSRCLSLPPEQIAELEQAGFIVSPSSRTGQALRIDRIGLDEIRREPEAHDLLAITARIACPVLVVHGGQDPTVPVAAAHELAGALGARGRLHVIEGADHVFNTVNPLPAETPASAELAELIEVTVGFVKHVA